MDNQTNPQSQSQQPNQAHIPNQTSTQMPPAQHAEQNQKLMGILSYLGILVIIPLLTTRQDPFVKFHIKQGLVLVCIEVLVWILGSMFWSVWIILNLVNIGTLILSIIGIINVVHKEQKELPLVGHLGIHFPV